MPNFSKYSNWSELLKLPNIAKVVEGQLNDVGINTIDDLMDIDSKKSWAKIKEIDEIACTHRLMARKEL